jgi:hypothetical protein
MQQSGNTAANAISDEWLIWKTQVAFQAKAAGFFRPQA